MKKNFKHYATVAAAAALSLALLTGCGTSGKQCTASGCKAYIHYSFARQGNCLYTCKQHWQAV